MRSVELAEPPAGRTVNYLRYEHYRQYRCRICHAVSRLNVTFSTRPVMTWYSELLMPVLVILYLGFLVLIISILLGSRPDDENNVKAKVVQAYV